MERIMKTEISIIVPIYNSEKCLHRCIDSILGQSFADFELILINDGSTDRSGEICDRYALKDNRIKVVHIENGGVSNARNTGIKLSRGKYLMFCDSDDHVEKDWCKNLYNAILEKPNTLPASGVRVIKHIGPSVEESIKAFKINHVISKKKYFPYRKKGLIRGSVINKIYTRNIIDLQNLNFHIGMARGEDVLFNLAYLNQIDSFFVLSSVDYNYVNTDDTSLMKTYSKELFFFISKEFNAWQDFFNQYQVDNADRKSCATHYFYIFIGVMKNTLDNRNPDGLYKKLKYNNKVLDSKEFQDCLELADLSKEDDRYIRLLKTKNYYLVWLVERLYLAKKYLTPTTRGKINN
jgi:glycosyltransferase involved in cell wall biosynthesis